MVFFLKAKAFFRKEKEMKTLLLILGVLALGMGLLWAGQGMGLIHWPASSFMLDQRIWAYIGGATALLGAITIWYSRR